MNSDETEKSETVEPTQLHPAHVSPPDFQSENQAAKHRRLPSKKISLIIAIAILLLGGGAGAYFFAFKKDDISTKPVAKNQTVSTPKKNLAVTPYDPSKELADCTKPGAEVLSVNWLNQRQKLADLKLIDAVSSESFPALSSEYDKVGTTKQGQSVVLIKFNTGTIDETDGIAIENSANHYLILTRLQPYFTNTTGQDAYLKLGANAELDTKKIISELCVGEISYKGQKLTTDSLPYDYFGTPIEIGATDKLLQTYDFGKLYDSHYKDDSNYYMSEFVLVTKDLRIQQFVLPQILKSNESNKYIPNIIWSDGTKNSKEYSTKFRGCGSSSSIEIAKNLTASELTKTGTAEGNVAIYGITSTNNPLFKVHYSEYQDDAANGTFDYTDGKTPKNLTAEAFLNSRPVIIVKDQVGRYIIYVNGDYNGGGGCGKPVIYLYPTHNTNVSVKVGADVVKSEPAYGSGWTNVLARPSGLLTVYGKNYNSLFWEGYGHGSYPDVSGVGAVVAQQDLKQTLMSQLGQLGLNSTEQTDFMDFWWPKMPSTPFVKLSWLGTKQMDKLAPLNVTPKPDTTIRIFLDFEGLQNPISLNAQHLSAVPRQGFTLVEWGGLLVGGIHN